MWKEVIEAEYVGGYCISVMFNDGVRKLIDFSPLIEQYVVFAPLRDTEVLRNFTLTDTLEWNNGMIDIAPEYLYDHGEVIVS